MRLSSAVIRPRYLGGVVYLMYRLPLVECLMFGALISATYPVTVLSIFQVVTYCVSWSFRDDSIYPYKNQCIYYTASLSHKDSPPTICLGYLLKLHFPFVLFLYLWMLILHVKMQVCC